MTDEPKPNVHFLIPMAHVMDVQRSLDFYAKLGFESLNTVKEPNGHLQWAHVRSGKAHLMFASDPESGTIEKESTVVLYMYAEDLVKLREELIATDVNVSETEPRFYRPKGEMCLNDPDGYVVLIGQSD